MAKEIKRCVIIGASPFNQPQFIKSNILPDDFVICADGGYDTAKKSNITPNIVIGDFDSATDEKSISAQKIILPVEKDDTDSIFCAKYAIEQGFKNIVLLGLTGGRIDHLYANFFLLKYLYNNNCNAVVSDSECNIYYTEKQLELHCKGDTVSILPFGCENACISLLGFKYHANKLVMTSDFPIGTSNISMEDTAIVNVHCGGVIVIENKNI